MKEECKSEERFMFILLKKKKRRRRKKRDIKKMVWMGKYVNSVEEHIEKIKVWDLWMNFQVMLVIMSS